MSTKTRLNWQAKASNNKVEKYFVRCFKHVNIPIHDRLSWNY